VGIIRRQTLQSSLLFYIGAALGFLIKVVVFTNFLTTEQVGLANILVTTAMMWASFSAIGFNSMALRFFPYFQDKTRRHHDFLFWLLLIPLGGFAVVSLLVLIFQNQIFDYFEPQSPILNDYFWYLFPLAFATLYFDLFDTYLRSLLKTVVPILFREIIQRVLIALSIILYALEWVTFPQFVAIYVGLISSVTLLMVIYVYWLGHLHLLPRRSWRLKKLFPRIMTYGGYTLLGNISVTILYNIDSLMLARYVDMDAVGIYTTAFYITALIMIPWRALQKIASPKVAEYFKSGNMTALNALYKRTSMLNLAVGLYLFGGMLIAHDLIYSLMPDTFKGGGVVLLIVGLTRVFDMVTGLNTYILIISNKFRLDLYINLGMLVFGVLLNMVMVPPLGITGAALATAFLIFLANVLRVAMVWSAYKLQPFSTPMLLVLGVFVSAFFLVFFLPTFNFAAISHFWNVLLTFLTKAGIFSAIVVALIYWSKVLPDINNSATLFLGKLRKR
jgi:O-antigen/teichoic acid export membrane protein